MIVGQQNEIDQGKRCQRNARRHHAPRPMNENGLARLENMGWVRKLIHPYGRGKLNDQSR